MLGGRALVVLGGTASARDAPEVVFDTSFDSVRNTESETKKRTLSSTRACGVNGRSGSGISGTTAALPWDSSKSGKEGLVLSLCGTEALFLDGLWCPIYREPTLSSLRRLYARSEEDQKSS